MNNGQMPPNYEATPPEL